MDLHRSDAAGACSLQPALATRGVAALGRAHVCMEEGVASLPPTPAQKTWFPKSADTAADALDVVRQKQEVRGKARKTRKYNIDLPSTMGKYKKKEKGYKTPRI